MVLPGHLAGGYLTARAVLAVAAMNGAALSPQQATALLVIGTLAGDGPDIDLIYMWLKQRLVRDDMKDNHRFYFTHFPLFWLAVGLAIALAGYLAGSAFAVYAALAIFLGAWSHLIFDSIEFGVPWLAPFSKHLFALRHMEEPQTGERPGSLINHWKFVTEHYLGWWSFYVEIAVTLAALWVAFRG